MRPPEDRHPASLRPPRAAVMLGPMIEPIAPARRRRWPWILGIGGLAVWALALVAGVVTLIATASGSLGGTRDWAESTVLGSGRSKVAIIRIEGEIVPGQGGTGLFASGLAADDYVSQLRQAGEDEDVRAVILRLDTPGGTVVATDEVYRAVRALEAAGKPVVASMGETAASGGYYIASGTRMIFANSETLTGSIGVIAMYLNMEGTAQKIGVKPIVIKSGRLKDMGSPYRDITPEERAILQGLINESYERFVGVVAEGRKLSVDAVRKIADGRVLSGEQALRAGLVDKIGGLEDAFEEARRLAGIHGSARLVEYRRPSVGLLGSLFASRINVGGEVRAALRQSGLDLAPPRPGLHYLWIQ